MKTAYSQQDPDGEIVTGSPFHNNKPANGPWKKIVIPKKDDIPVVND